MPRAADKVILTTAGGIEEGFTSLKTAVEYMKNSAGALGDVIITMDDNTDQLSGDGGDVYIPTNKGITSVTITRSERLKTEGKIPIMGYISSGVGTGGIIASGVPIILNGCHIRFLMVGATYEQLEQSMDSASLKIIDGVVEELHYGSLKGDVTIDIISGQVDTLSGDRAYGLWTGNAHVSFHNSSNIKKFDKLDERTTISVAGLLDVEEIYECWLMTLDILPSWEETITEGTKLVQCNWQASNISKVSLTFVPNWDYPDLRVTGELFKECNWYYGGTVGEIVGRSNNAKFPVITNEGTNQIEKIYKESAKFEIEISPTDMGTVTYAWYKKPNATDTTSGVKVGNTAALDLTNMGVGTGYYYCVITNKDKDGWRASTVSTVKTLVVLPKPVQIEIPSYPYEYVSGKTAKDYVKFLYGASLLDTDFKAVFRNESGVEMNVPNGNGNYQIIVTILNGNYKLADETEVSIPIRVSGGSGNSGSGNGNSGSGNSGSGNGNSGSGNGNSGSGNGGSGNSGSGNSGSGNGGSESGDSGSGNGGSGKELGGQGGGFTGTQGNTIEDIGNKIDKGLISGITEDENGNEQDVEISINTGANIIKDILNQNQGGNGGTGGTDGSSEAGGNNTSNNPTISYPIQVEIGGENTEATVKIPLPGNMDYTDETIKVVHVKENGETENIPVTIKKDNDVVYIEFDATDSEIYIIEVGNPHPEDGQPQDGQAEDGKPKDPKPGKTKTEQPKTENPNPKTPKGTQPIQPEEKNNNSSSGSGDRPSSIPGKIDINPEIPGNPKQPPNSNDRNSFKKDDVPQTGESAVPGRMMIASFLSLAIMLLFKNKAGKR